MNSFDPRVNRLTLNEQNNYTIEEGENWQAFQVFHQKKRGDQHQHVGIVHAPSADLALMFAKEQYARRQKCVNLWVVASKHILAFAPDDEDIFTTATAPEKMYREAGGFKVMERINKLKGKK